MRIGQILKKARLEKQLSVKEVSIQLQVAESTYRDWENGRNIQGEPYLKIAQVLDVPLGNLIGVNSNVAIENLKKDVEVLDEQVRKIKQNVHSLI